MLTLKHLQVGFENELECPSIEGVYGSNVALHAKTKADLAFGVNFGGRYHSDATIDYGFEFASYKVPDSSLFLNGGKEDVTFSKLFNFWANDMGARAEDNTGMHIHLDKESVGAVEALKMNYFVFRNQTFCEMIGERKAGEYCEANENPVNFHKINALSANNTGANLPYSKRFIGYRPSLSYLKDNMKYRMLNVARDQTIEFRFFKATVDYNVFLKNMQFVIALAMFVRESGFSIIDYRVGGETIQDFEGTVMPGGNRKVQKAFCDYVYKNRKAYKNLYLFLAECEFCPKPKAIQKKRKKKAAKPQKAKVGAKAPAKAKAKKKTKSALIRAFAQTV